MLLIKCYLNYKLKNLFYIYYYLKIIFFENKLTIYLFNSKKNFKKKFYLEFYKIF